MKVRMVTAYVPLKVKHLNAETYHLLGHNLTNAAGAKATVFDHFPLEECWLHKHEWVRSLPPAAPVPGDRYETPEQNVLSNIVQHNRTDWAMRAQEIYPDTDVWAWLDFGILKQGGWNKKPIMQEHVQQFLYQIEKAERWDCIPFPGITDVWPYSPFGNNWRFCGSTHIWPTKFLPLIDRVYKEECLNFITKHHRVPLDLAIWPLVEQHPQLPFRWYKAEYDHTQLTEFHHDLAVRPDPAVSPS